MEIVTVNRPHGRAAFIQNAARQPADDKASVELSTICKRGGFDFRNRLVQGAVTALQAAKIMEGDSMKKVLSAAVKELRPFEMQ